MTFFVPFDSSARASPQVQTKYPIYQGVYLCVGRSLGSFCQRSTTARGGPVRVVSVRSDEGFLPVCVQGGKRGAFEVSEKTRAQVEEAYGGHLAGKRSQRENWQVHREYKAPDDRAEYRKDEGLHHLLYCV